MHGLVSLLDQAHTEQVEVIWQLLKYQCGLSGVKTTPYPHFSWQVAKGYDWDALGNRLVEIAQAFSPFQVRTSGLGLFTGEQPVLYIPVVRTSVLHALHLRIWEVSRSISMDISPYYAPDSWKPHITIAQGDLNLDTVSCAIQQLARQNFDWVIPIDNLAVIYATDDQVATLHDRYPLQGEVQAAG